VRKENRVSQREHWHNRGDFGLDRGGLLAGRTSCDDGAIRCSPRELLAGTQRGVGW
jgi:hypothetical protein